MRCRLAVYPLAVSLLLLAPVISAPMGLNALIPAAEGWSVSVEPISAGLQIPGAALAGEPLAGETEKAPPKPTHEHLNGEICFLEVLQAMSGKRCARKTVDMLRNVVEISREEDRIVIVRSNAETVAYPRGTEYGDKMFEGLDEAEQKLSQKLGAPGASLIPNLSKISLKGNHVQFIRTGPEKLVLAIPEGKHYIPVTVKRVELGPINMDVDMKKGYPTLRNIEGIRAVVHATGVDLPIDLREFGRRKDKDGDTHLRFGIKSWVPEPVRNMLGMPEVMPVSYTIKNKDKKHHHRKSHHRSSSEQPKVANEKAGEDDTPETSAKSAR